MEWRGKDLKEGCEKRSSLRKIWSVPKSVYKPGNGGVKIREFTFVFPLSLSNQAVEEKINIFIIVINPNTKNPKSGNKSFLFRIPG